MKPHPSKLLPTGSNVLLRIHEKLENTTPGGIVMPSTSTKSVDNCGRATVIAVGPLVMCCAVGDVVLIGKLSGWPVLGADGGRYFLGHSDGVVAIDMAASSQQPEQHQETIQ